MRCSGESVYGSAFFKEAVRPEPSVEESTAPPLARTRRQSLSRRGAVASSIADNDVFDAQPAIKRQHVAAPSTAYVGNGLRRPVRRMCARATQPTWHRTY